MEAGESARFEAVVLPHLDAAYTLARYLARNGPDADDVVQEACLRALRYFDELHAARRDKARVRGCWRSCATRPTLAAARARRDASDRVRRDTTQRRDRG